MKFTLYAITLIVAIPLLLKAQDQNLEELSLFNHPKALEGWLFEFQDPFEEVLDLDLLWHDRAWPRTTPQDLAKQSPGN